MKKDPTYLKSVELYEELIADAAKHLEEMVEKFGKHSGRAEIAADDLYRKEKRLHELRVNHGEGGLG